MAQDCQGAALTSLWVSAHLTEPTATDYHTTSHPGTHEVRSPSLFQSSLPRCPWAPPFYQDGGGAERLAQLRTGHRLAKKEWGSWEINGTEEDGLH